MVLLAAAPSPALMPPPYLLPPEVEYQTAIGDEALMGLLGYSGENKETRDTRHETRDTRHEVRRQGDKERSPPLASRVSPSLIAWADQLCAALPDTLLRPLAEAVRTARMRWQPGFAQVALAGAMPCGVGACLACLVETRDGWRSRCKDGPVFDLRAFR